MAFFRDDEQPPVRTVFLKISLVNGVLLQEGSLAFVSRPLVTDPLPRSDRLLRFGVNPLVLPDVFDECGHLDVVDGGALVPSVPRQRRRPWGLRWGFGKGDPPVDYVCRNNVGCRS